MEGETGFFNSITSRPGDFCGEELLAWALLPKSTLNLPSSTRTVRALEEVEAFALRAEDLKFVQSVSVVLVNKETRPRGEGIAQRKVDDGGGGSETRSFRSLFHWVPSSAMPNENNGYDSSITFV
ncbi:hypothetical protein D5086_014035 [Populus alba]|uniref:Uncharacterized protein n=1 Tax=Populus alba TaxID=43335 RepID=A0ACC4C7H6_POPAL